VLLKFVKMLYILYEKLRLCNLPNDRENNFAKKAEKKYQKTEVA